MNEVFKTYQRFMILLAVFVISAASAFFLHVNELYLPAMLALIVAIGRDEAAYTKQKELQLSQQHFELSAGAHMANVAFNKYVEFCEKYIAAVREGLTTLIGSGPMRGQVTGKILNRITDVRQEYITWISSSIDTELNQFERPLQTMWLNVVLFEETAEGDEITKLERKALVQKLHADYRQVLGIQYAEGKQPSEEEKQRSLAHVTIYLKNMLGIEQLTELRQRALVKLKDR